MNVGLYSDFLYAKKRARKYSELRSDISLPSGLGLSTPDKENKYLTVPFRMFLEREGFSNDVKILKINKARARIVFSTVDSSGTQVIVKWNNHDAVGCFNFIGSMEAEKEMHISIATQGTGFIPRCYRHGEDFIVVEYVRGVPLLHLMAENKVDKLPVAIAILLKDLQIIYETTKNGVFGPAQFNRTLLRDLRYLVSIRGKTGFEALLASFHAPALAQKRYLQASDYACAIYSSLSEALPACMTIRDLDEHNLIFNETQGQFHAVDMEDAESGHYVFDLAFLSARLLLSDKPRTASREVLPLFEEFISRMERKDSGHFIKFYRTLTVMQLTIAAMNPWLWPSELSFEREAWPWRRRSQWLKEVWSVINSMYRELGL